MIDKKYVEICSKQKEKLLEEKKKLGFFKRMFFRRYTDWVLTDVVNSWKNQKYIRYGGEIEKYGDPSYYKTQLSIRMKLSNGSIQKDYLRV